VTAVAHLEEVTKAFGDVVALSAVTFSVEDGMTALLGPNGAGKSTIIRLLTGLTGPTSGTVEVFGHDPRGNVDVAASVGLVPQQEALFAPLSAHDFVATAAELHGLSDPGARATALLHRVDLDPTDRRPLKTYSKGMRQRVKLAQALVHDPPMLITDEPLNGLDPRQRLRIIELFRSLAAEGRTVLVSSHVLDEVERFGSRILLFARGRLVAEGDFHAIRDALDDRPRQLRVRTSAPRAVASRLLAADAVDGVTVVGNDVLEILTSDVTAFRAAVAVAARDADAHLLEVSPRDESLEAVFRYLVERPR